MEQQTGTFAVKKGLAQMLKGGVIMDVVTPEHAKIAEEAGACAVMALERVPADIRAQGGVARMSDPDLILQDHGHGHHPGHGQMPHRPFRRSADPGSHWGRLHRRVRSFDPGGRGEPHPEAQFQGAIRVRLPQPGRGSAPHRRRCGHDPHQGRSRHRRRGRSRPACPHRAGRNPPPDHHG